MPNIYPYRDLVEIGRGGMATVYRATAPNGNLVALKVLAVHLALDQTARMRFEQEAGLGLSHPNIIRVMDWGIEDDAPFIVMDYIVGESLDRKLTRDGTMDPKDLGRILRDTAEALDYAHARLVIHRDVKPSNILLRDNDIHQALLGDFGVAKSAGLTAFTATAARVGSVFYMSPEQANGAPELTYSSDIYSLGVTAYYALAGRHPFEADNEIAIARMHMDAKPKHVSDINPAIPRAVGSVVMQALEKDPMRRPKSAGDFAKAFNNAVYGLVPSRPRRLWQGLLVAAGVCVLIIVVGVLSLTQAAPPPATPTETPEPTASFTSSPVSVILAVTNTPSLTPTMTPTASRTPTTTPTTTATATASPTVTPKPIKATVRPTPRPPPNTPKPRPTSTRIPTSTATIVSTTVATPTAMATVTATVHPTGAATVTPLSTSVPTTTPQPTLPTGTKVGANTPTPTTVVHTLTPSHTPTLTATAAP